MELRSRPAGHYNISPVVPAPMAVAPAGFALEDVFLMYGDGRLIQHTTRRMRADMDVDVMTSMLKAVQDFVKDSIGAADRAELGAMEYGESKILLQKGRWVILAAVITGGEPEGFRDEMRAAIANIEGAIARADDLIDSYLRGIYDGVLPLASPPQSVIAASAEIAVFLLWQSTSCPEDENPLLGAYKRHMQWLRDVSSGKAVLDLTGGQTNPNASASYKGDYADRQFSPATLRGWF